jgi:hypothetical protein
MMPRKKVTAKPATTTKLKESKKKENISDDLLLPAATMLWGVLESLKPEQGGNVKASLENDTLTYNLWKLRQQIEQLSGEQLTDFYADALIIIEDLETFTSDCKKALKNLLGDVDE